jgi:hypothetical protein
MLFMLKAVLFLPAPDSWLLPPAFQTYSELRNVINWFFCVVLSER